MLISVALNVGSLIFGLVAWIVPFLSFKKLNDVTRKIVISFSACVAALCLQFFEMNHRVQVQDWAALMDTMGALKWIAVILSVITILLNVFVAAGGQDEREQRQ